MVANGTSAGVAPAKSWSGIDPIDTLRIAVSHAESLVVGKRALAGFPVAFEFAAAASGHYRFFLRCMEGDPGGMPAHVEWAAVSPVGIKKWIPLDSVALPAVDLARILLGLHEMHTW